MRWVSKFNSELESVILKWLAFDCEGRLARLVYRCRRRSLVICISREESDDNDRKDGSGSQENRINIIDCACSNGYALLVLCKLCEGGGD